MCVCVYLIFFIYYIFISFCCYIFVYTNIVYWCKFEQVMHWEGSDSPLNEKNSKIHRKASFPCQLAPWVLSRDQLMDHRNQIFHVFFLLKKKKMFLKQILKSHANHLSSVYAPRACLAHLPFSGLNSKRNSMVLHAAFCSSSQHSATFLHSEESHIQLLTA